MAFNVSLNAFDPELGLSKRVSALGRRFPAPA
jgi:hypothetical protein